MRSVLTLPRLVRYRPILRDIVAGRLTLPAGDHCCSNLPQCRAATRVAGCASLGAAADDGASNRTRVLGAARHSRLPDAEQRSLHVRGYSPHRRAGTRRRRFTSRINLFAFRAHYRSMEAAAADVHIHLLWYDMVRIVAQAKCGSTAMRRRSHLTLHRCCCVARPCATSSGPLA